MAGKFMFRPAITSRFSHGARIVTHDDDSWDMLPGLLMSGLTVDQPAPQTEQLMKPAPASGGDLRAKILRLLAQPKYQPLDKVELTKKLGLKADDRPELKELLREMEQEGAVARIKKDRYVLPDAADLFPGVIHFNDKGYAFVINEKKDGQSDLFITAENTWTALHGDRVLARVNREGFVDARERRYRGPGAGQRREGRVIRILKRANETVVGTLQKSKQFFYVVADDPRFIHNIYVHPEPDRAAQAAGHGRQGRRASGAVGDAPRQPGRQDHRGARPGGEGGRGHALHHPQVPLAGGVPARGHAGGGADSRSRWTTQEAGAARRPARTISSSRSTPTTRAISTTPSAWRSCPAAGGGWASTSRT